jgi:ankyrin repeat protein
VCFKTPQASQIVQDIAARCRYIVEAKASYTEDRNEYGQTALHCAVLENDVAATLELLKGPVDVNAVDLNGNTPLIAAAEKGNFDVMIVLLQQPVIDVDKQANNNKSVIHYMCNARLDVDERKWASVMSILKRANVDLNTIADFGETPLHQAIKGGKIDVVSWLIDNMARVNSPNK